MKIETLASDPSWVNRSENLLFFGSSGTGKTHLAAAICNGLIEQDVRVRHYQATALVQELQRAREELQLERVFARLDRYAVSPEAISPVNPTLPSQLVVLFSALGSILSIIFQNGNVDREIVVKQPELYQ